MSGALRQNQSVLGRILLLCLLLAFLAWLWLNRRRGLLAYRFFHLELFWLRSMIRGGWLFWRSWGIRQGDGEGVSLFLLLRGLLNGYDGRHRRFNVKSFFVLLLENMVVVLFDDALYFF